MNHNTVEMWHEILGEYPYLAAYNALIQYMKTKTRTPKPADIMPRIDQGYKDNMTINTIRCDICNGIGFVTLKNPGRTHNCTCRNEHIQGAKTFIEAEIDLNLYTRKLDMYFKDNDDDLKTIKEIENISSKKGTKGLIEYISVNMKSVGGFKNER